jgi:Protein kinase domain/Domain of Unknown Function (DUF1080)
LHLTASQHPSALDLTAYVRGTLSSSAAQWVGQHLQECADCRTAAAILRSAPATEIAAGQGAATYSDAATQIHSPADIPSALRDHPRYRILRQLGRGGMGVVYQAEHRVMERLVAIKVITQALVDKPEAVERFQREVRAAAKLDHPNIVKAYDAEQAGDLQLLAMEYVEGQSLADVLAKKGPLPIANACYYIRQAALGLQHAFEQGMVHRDLKPQNLMLTPKGVVKILDFGLAKLASEQSRPGAGLTQENAVMGTPEYMAPEQAINTKAADIRADIYALGCTLYCLLSGRPPFSGDSALEVILAQHQQEPPPVESLRAELPAPLADLVRRMLAKKPADRPQTPKEVAEALAPFARPAMKAGDAETVEAITSLAQLPKRRSRWMIPGAVAAGIALVAIGLWAGALFRIKAKDALLVVEVNEPNAEVFVDGERMAVPWADGDKTTVIRVQPGTHKVEVKKDGFTATGTDIAVEARGRVVFPAQLKPTVRKPGVEELEQLAAELRRLEYGQLPIRERWRNHALDKVKTAIAAIESDAHGTSADISRSLDRVRADIADLKNVTSTNALNRKALAEAERYLDAAIAARTVPKGDARIAAIFNGQWSIDGQDIVQNEPTGLANIRFGSLDWTDYDFSCDVQLIHGTGHAAAVIRTPGAGEAYFFWLGAGTTMVDYLLHGFGQRQSTVLVSHETTAATLQPDHWHAVRVRVRGDQIQCYLNDELWLECKNSAIAKGRVGLNALNAACRFRNLRVTDASGALFWEGLPTLPDKAPEPNPPVAPTPVAEPSRPQGFVQLFNGKDLTGWEPFPGGTAQWSVENGVIVGRVGHGYLFSNRGNYSDFHIRAEAKASPGANSGVFFRMPYTIDPTTGYEAQIDAGTDPYPTGSLYGVVAAPRDLVKLDEWFTIEVIAVGPRIQILVNGKETVNYTDPKPRSLRGFFALQQLFPNREIRFRKVEVKELK